MSKKFADFDLDEQLLEALSYMGFETATPVQEQAIPQIIADKDLIVCAQTGTGKTAAFILPILHKLMQKKHTGINTLIIVPTRELAIQIDQEIEAFSYFTHAQSLPLYGGDSGSNWGQEKTALTDGAEIIVATPGKLLAHLNMGYVDFSHLEHLILDEADRMLDIGFHDDILKIISYLPKKRQSLMFSATMPKKIEQLAKKILTNPFKISLAISKPAEGVLQAAYLTYEEQKTPLVIHLLKDKEEYESIIIFCATRKKVSELMRGLKAKGLNTQSISSNLEQHEREEVLLQFKARKIRVLVATDVISRGIDIKDINLVINYDVPNEGADYVHRVGRTARAATTGVALTLISPDDMWRFQQIESLIEKEIIKLPIPPELGESPKWEVKKYKENNTRGKKKNWKKKK